MIAAGTPEPGIQLGVGGLVLTVVGTVLVAAITTAGVYLAARQSRAAQAQTAAIEGRRLKLEEQEQNRRYDADLIERLHREIERLNEEIARLERLGHSRAAEQALRCRAALDHLSDSLEALVSVVRNEVAAEAARDAVKESNAHLSTDHTDDEQLEG